MSEIKTEFINFKLAKYEETEGFGRNQENRVYNPTHLRGIKAQWLTSAELIPPITVNVVTNNIIDGQHRLKAFREQIEAGVLDKETRIKVMFVSVPIELEKQAIVDANTHSKNWSLDDYIHSYIRAGIVSYCKLEEWCKVHALCYNYQADNESKEQCKKYKYRYGASILTGRRCQDELKSASFSFTDEDEKIGNEVHTELMEIIDLFDLPNYGAWIEALAVMWHKFRAMHPFKVWLKEMKAKKNRLMKMPKITAEDWKNIFANIHSAIDMKSDFNVAA